MTTEKSSSKHAPSDTPCWKVVTIAIIAGVIGITIGTVGCWLHHYLEQKELATAKSNSKDSKPNIIIFLADDTGYGDFRSYGHPTQEWTGIDRMAAEGMRFTQFYTPESTCTPSRAAILTGRYPVRSGMFGDERVLFRVSPGGIPRSEVTVAEIAKKAGYVTGMGGKWHLGINRNTSTDGYYLPKHHGFDEVNTFLPWSQNWICRQDVSYSRQLSDNCFLYNGDTIVEQPINLGTLTSKLLNDALNFISTHKGDRFFYLLSFPQTHAALFANAQFSGKSRRGPYGDNVNEMGWAVNEVLSHLVNLGIERETFTLFLSDHGAVRSGCAFDGSNGPFRGGKLSTWDGGVRIPAVAWWPGVIQPQSVNNDILSTLDILPTIKELTGLRGHIHGQPPVDGISFDAIIRGKESSSQRSALNNATVFFYCSNLTTAVRHGRFKVHFYTSRHSDDEIVMRNERACMMTENEQLLNYARQSRCKNVFEKQVPPLIFDMETDPEEHISLDPKSHSYKKIMEAVTVLVRDHRATVKPLESELGREWNPKLQPCCNPPLCMCNFEE